MVSNRKNETVGYPYIIQHDNGKNFAGSESKLKAALKSLDTKK